MCGVSNILDADPGSILNDETYLLQQVGLVFVFICDRFIC